MAKRNYEFKDLDKTQQSCLTLIESLGIYELRALARVFGDNSPTTLKRNDHIVIVMKKIISGEDLKPIPLRQGRPYKELSNIEGILAELSQITGKDYNLRSHQPRTSINFAQKHVTFKQVEENVIKQKLFPIQVRGILCERNDKEFYFINIDNGTYVLVKKELDDRLKPYDYITGSAVVMNEEKEYILDSLSSINYTSMKDYKEVEEEEDDTSKTKKVKLGGFNLELGSRHLVKTGRFSDYAAIGSLISKLKENKIVSVALIPNVMPEDLFEINNLGFNSAFLMQYNARPINMYETICNFIEHISRLQKMKRNIAVFVQDIPTLASAVDYSFKNNTKALMGHTETAVETVKKLMLLAKGTRNETFTTLFLTQDEADMFDQMYVSSVYKVSKKLEG